MKQALFLVLICISLSIQAQTFTIRILPPAIDSNASMYMMDNGDFTTLKPSWHNGALVFSGTTPTFRRAMLSVGVKRADGTLNPRRIEVIIEPGEVLIDAKGGFHLAEYRGSQMQRDLTDYLRSFTAVSQLLEENANETAKMKKEGNRPSLERLYNEAELLRQQRSAAQLAWFRSHPGSPVTALMLENFVTTLWSNTAEAKVLYDALPASLRNLPDVERFGRDLEKAATVAVGQLFPDISLPDADGQLRSVASFKGKYLFIDLWASWCKPCREESPAIVAAYNMYKQHPFDILHVSFDTDKQKWLKAIEKDGFTWTNIVDSTGFGSKGDLTNRLAIYSIPRSFLLDPEGRIIAVNLKGVALEMKLKEIFGTPAN